MNKITNISEISNIDSDVSDYSQPKPKNLKEYFHEL